MPYAMRPWHLFLTALTGAWLLLSASLGPPRSLLQMTDIVNGVLVLVLCAIIFRKPSYAAQWALAAIGVVCCAAPLFLWAPRLGQYLNDTFAGIALLTFAAILPHLRETSGPETGPGWSYN